MYKDWLKKECNIKLNDYKRLSKEEKLNLYNEWIGTIGKPIKCPYCGEELMCGSDVWTGEDQSAGLTMSMVATPSGTIFGRLPNVISPMLYMCMKCGYTGMFATKKDRELFRDTCCDIKYHV